MGSVLDVGLLEALLDSHSLLIGDEDLLFSVKLELIIHGLSVELLNLVLI